MQVRQVSRANRESEAEIFAIRKQLAEKNETIDILKNRRHPVEIIVDKYRYIQTLHHPGTTVEQACRFLGISPSGYYG